MGRNGQNAFPASMKMAFGFNAAYLFRSERQASGTLWRRRFAAAPRSTLLAD
jgi:hypothetical protein